MGHSLYFTRFLFMFNQRSPNENMFGIYNSFVKSTYMNASNRVGGTVVGEEMNLGFYNDITMS